MMLMTSSVGRESARQLVTDALAQSRETGKTFRETLLASPEAVRAIPADALRTIDVPEDYLGVAETLRIQLLEQ